MSIYQIISKIDAGILELERQSRYVNFKTPEYDNLMMGSYDLKEKLDGIRQCMNINAVIEKLNRNEQIQKSAELIEKENADVFQILTEVQTAAAPTILWAKKMSWVGEWDFNWNGFQSTLAISLGKSPAENAPPESDMNFFTGEGINALNYKIEVKFSELGFIGGYPPDFGKAWNNFNFLLDKDDHTEGFEATVFEWDRSKFGGLKSEKPFYAIRTTEFFGKNYI